MSEKKSVRYSKPAGSGTSHVGGPGRPLTWAGKSFKPTKVATRSSKRKASRAISSGLSELPEFVSQFLMTPATSRKVTPATLLRVDEKDDRRFEMVPSPLTTTLMRGMLGTKVFSAELATALTMSSNGSGNVNSLIATSTATTIGEFGNFASLFSEFFIKSFTVTWQPSGRYTGPLGFTLSGFNVANKGIGIASYHHDTAYPSSLAALANNPTTAYHNSGDPFSYRWVNVEKPSSTVVVNAGGSSSAVGSQGWCLTESIPSGAYTGGVIILSNSGSDTLPATAILGTFLYRASLLFRCRV